MRKKQETGKIDTFIIESFRMSLEPTSTDSEREKEEDAEGCKLENDMMVIWERYQANVQAFIRIVHYFRYTL